MKFNVTSTDTVLEVGSGDNPRDESTVLLDRYITTNHQRAGKFNMRIDRPLVVGNGYKLPFKDKSFDYIICSHVLEHTSDPIAFAKELMRVGKRGYVEVPNIYGERLFGWSFHLWHCELKGNTLKMTAKREGERFGEFFHTLIAKQIWFRRFFEKNEKKFYIQFEWNNKFQIIVSKKEYSAAYLGKIDRKIWELLRKIDWNISEDFLFYAAWMVKRIKRKMRKVLQYLLWKIKISIFSRSITTNLLSKMECIHCKGELALKNTIVCLNCKTKYALRGTIPIMLTLKELKEGY